MARPNKPWYCTARLTWFVEIAGKQVPLVKGPKDATRKEAYQTFNRLMEQTDAPDAKGGRESLVSFHGRYLSWVKKHKADATYGQRRHFLKSFVLYLRG